jgi:CubicO group peptidase (beta-lactamase class C family)
MNLSTTPDLPRRTPESQGLASATLLKLIETLELQTHEIHSLMILRHGNVVAEGWWSPYAAFHPHMMFSVSKSFTASAIGLAISEGLFSIDDSVIDFFPQDVPSQPDAFLAAMRVRDLLCMSTGQDVDTWSSMVARSDGNWSRGFFEVTVRHTPGTHFVYNTGATYMLSAIVQRTSGMTLLEYLQPRLFQRLGITDAAWFSSPQGITAGGIGLSIKTEDLAKFGQLFLQKGQWQGEQLLPKGWVEEASAFQADNSQNGQSDWRQGYGYQFWRCRHNAYRADGVFGQYGIVMPDQDAIVAMTSGVDVFDMQQPLELIWDILLPAMSSDALPEDATAYDALQLKLNSLSRPTVAGKPLSPIASEVSGRTYRVDTNALGIVTIAFDFNVTGCTLTIESEAGVDTLQCGYGSWVYSLPIALFAQSFLFDRTPAAASGAWTRDDTFTAIIRLYETPHYHTLNISFIGDELMLESRINVSLESMEPVLVTGRQ